MEKNIEADLLRILNGKGMYPYSVSINRIVTMLYSKDFGFNIDYLLGTCYQNYKEQDWIKKFDGARANWLTFLSMKVMYCLVELKEIILDNPDKTTVSGALRLIMTDPYLMDNMEMYTEHDTESDYRQLLLRETYIEFLGEDLAERMLVGMTRKQIAEELGKEYKSYCKTINRRMEKLKQALIDRELD